MEKMLAMKVGMVKLRCKVSNTAGPIKRYTALAEFQERCAGCCGISVYITIR